MPYEIIESNVRPVSFEEDFEYVIGKMRALRAMSNRLGDLARDAIRELSDMRKMFAEVFIGPRSVRIDFILQAHEAVLGMANVSGFNPAVSRQLVKRLILENRYDFVVTEGAVFDGYAPEVRSREIFSRLKYARGSSLWNSLVHSGANPNNYESARPHLQKLPSTGSIDSWFDLEVQSGALFLGGEIVTLTVLMSALLEGKVKIADPKTLMSHVQRLRSAYPVAKVITHLQESDKSSAIVFGFLHQNDFREIASSLGLTSTTHNATGVEWERIRRR